MKLLALFHLDSKVKDEKHSHFIGCCFDRCKFKRRIKIYFHILIFIWILLKSGQSEDDILIEGPCRAFDIKVHDPRTCCKYPKIRICPQINATCKEICNKHKNLQFLGCMNACLIEELGMYVNGTFFPEKVIEHYSESQVKDVLSVEWKEVISKSMSKCEHLCKLHNNFDRLKKTFFSPQI